MTAARRVGAAAVAAAVAATESPSDNAAAVASKTERQARSATHSVRHAQRRRSSRTRRGRAADAQQHSVVLRRTCDPRLLQHDGAMARRCNGGMPHGCMLPRAALRMTCQIARRPTEAGGYTRDALHCTALHCTALHCTALHCAIRVSVLRAYWGADAVMSRSCAAHTSGLLQQRERDFDRSADSPARPRA